MSIFHPFCRRIIGRINLCSHFLYCGEEEWNNPCFFLLFFIRTGIFAEAEISEKGESSRVDFSLAVILYIYCLYSLYICMDQHVSGLPTSKEIDFFCPKLKTNSSECSQCAPPWLKWSRGVKLEIRTTSHQTAASPVYRDPLPPSPCLFFLNDYIEAKRTEKPTTEWKKHRF